jgi:hypothetical protein
MHTSTMPKTIAKWASANPKLVEEVTMECDGFGENSEGPWSVWLYLAPGWKSEATDGHMIHEPTVKYFMEAARMVVPCDCGDCA